jgi:hypothetical protein
MTRDRKKMQIAKEFIEEIRARANNKPLDATGMTYKKPSDCVIFFEKIRSRRDKKSI